MNRTLLAYVIVAMLVAAPPALAASQDVGELSSGTFQLDRKHASVVAKVRHMGVSLFTVRFNSFEGAFTYDKSHPEAANVTASVDAASLDANGDYSGKFAEEFLGASKNPKITFVSTEVRRGEGNRGTMAGNLTLRGVTKPVTWDVTFQGTGKNPIPPFRTLAGFTATTTIKRSDFGSDFLQNGIVADEVTLIVEAEFEKK